MVKHNDELCFFQLPDGTVECRKCDDEPADSTNLGPAPEDTPIGPVLPGSGVNPIGGGDN
jgi:hypothetical protein